MMSVNEYLSFLQKEYLEDFVLRGGAAVKFVVARDPDRALSFQDSLRSVSTAANYIYARVSAEDAKAHMVDQIFFSVARQVDWQGLAASFVSRAWEAIGTPVGPTGDLQVRAQAEHHDLDARELNISITRELQKRIFRDYAMAQEFRIAMIRVCQNVLDDNEATAGEREAVVDWLSGDLRLISRLRSALIFHKIARHNARHMLLSLARWITCNGYAGLVLDLDIGRCLIARKPAVDERSGVYYSKPQVMDTYEVLRQLVDATDELSSTFVVVVAPPEFLTDDARGLSTYSALQLRISDEVRDAHRPNPFASLVRLESDE